LKKSHIEKRIKSKIPKVARSINYKSKSNVEALSSSNTKREFINRNYRKIVQAINEAKYYPRIARKRGIEGVVRVKFVLFTNGSVSIREIETSQKYLGKAAKEAIKKASIYFPKPSQDIEFSIAIEFKLE